MTKEAHADLIAQVYLQACVDALHAAQRQDASAENLFHAVADALQAAYPRECRAVHESYGRRGDGEDARRKDSANG